MKFEEYKELIQKANLYAYHYYTLDDPIVTDEEYDKIYKRIEEYEREHEPLEYSPTQRVGGVVLDSFEKGEHFERMWSLDDLFNLEELKSWCERIYKKYPSASFLCEPKFDGASLNLIYEDGTLKKAITRGDGLVGENVTENAKTIRSIPLQIEEKNRIEIRGEVLIKKDDFENINKERAKKEQPLFANPRNAAAGSLRQLNTKITSERKLLFIPWGIGENSLKESKLSKKIEMIYTFGFTKPPMLKLCNNIEEIEEFYHELKEKRLGMSVLLDGMVIKVDEIEIQKELGFTIKSPRFASAYKFPAVEKEGKIVGISYQVGRSGVVTPVANLEPIDIDGATISRATLHNFDDLGRKDIRIGDSVIIIRSGDVIPKIIKPLAAKRDGSEKEIEKPKECPICQSELLDEGALLKCQNLSCPARVLNSIIHFASKKALNIDGLGKNIIELLFEKEIIKDVVDLFEIKKERLLELEGFKEKKAQNIIDAIDASKKLECWRFVNALGIEHIGEGASKQICKKMGLFWFEKNQDEFESIEGFGVEMARSLTEFARVNKEKILKLIEILEPKEVELEEVDSNSFLKDKIVVITGTLEMNRDTLKEMLEKAGAKVTNSVSKKTDILICGENAGSKLDRAKELGVRIVTNEELESFILP